MNKNKLTKNLLIITIFLSLFLISLSSANAVNVTLNPGDAGGVNSAVSTVANGSDAGNTITLNPGTYNKTTDRNNNITFNGKNLTIQGNGSAGSVIIDAQKAGRLFSITGNSNITFINITFINGNITGSGGAISKTGTGILNLINCTFSNNNVSANGGAIYNTAGELNIINSNFANNIARGSTGGGAIYKTNGIFSIRNCNFTNNTSPNGGAITCEDTVGSLVTNSTFSNNTATGSGSGGAIFSQFDEELIINSSQFRNNSASFGGACSINGNLFSEIINSVFTNNSASGEGGAIEDNDNGYLTILNSSFTNNTSPTGGAIFNYRLSDNTTIINSSFVNNNASIVVRGKNTTINGCDFTNNPLAINITGNNTIISGSNIINNAQGIFVNSSAVNTTINYNRILNNTNTTGFNLDNNPSTTNANLNWWGDNSPSVNGISLSNWFAMVLSIDEVYKTMVNSTVNRTPGLYNLSYQLLLYNNTTEAFQSVSYGNLPDFLVNVTWKDSNGNIVSSVSNVNAKGQYSYLANLISNGNFTVEATGDNEDLILIVAAEQFIGNVNLTLNKSVNVTGNVSKGEKIRYTITITNNGPNDAFNVVVTDLLPSSLVLLSSSHDLGSWDPVTGLWEIENLANGQTATLIINVLVNGTGTITNFANVTTDDNNTGNTNANVTITAKLKTNTTINVPSKVKIGETVTISGVLYDQEGNPVPNAQLTVRVNNNIYTVMTDTEGRWSLQYKTTHLGTIQITASFAGSELYFASENTTTFEVIQEPQNETNETNRTNGTIETNQKSVATATMKKTGIPIISILIVLLSTLGLVYRKK